MEPIDLMERDQEKEEQKRQLSRRRRLVLLVVLIILPVYLLFQYFGREDAGRTASLVSAVTAFAVWLRWDLRKHVWFWATVIVVFCAHIPVILTFRWPHQWISGVELTPFGLADGLIMLGCIWLVEKLVSIIKRDNRSMNSNRPLG
jgi:hypothetical protein